MRSALRALLAALFCGVALAPASTMAQEAAPVEPQFGNIQIIRNPRETVIVISGVGPLEKQSGLMMPGDLAGQMKQTLENLRRIAIRAGVLPSQIVVLTVFTPETQNVEALRQMPRNSYSDWNPVTAVETRQLSTEGVLIEIEAVAIAREAKPR